MSTFHAVVWMDHAEAHVLHFDTEHAETLRIEGHVQRQSSKKPDHAFFDQIATAIGAAGEVLMTGPASAKHEFVKYAQTHRPGLAKKVIGIETLDHPSDAQLIAYARKYFLRIDRMNGSPTPT